MNGQGRTNSDNAAERAADLRGRCLVVTLLALLILLVSGRAVLVPQTPDEADAARFPGLTELSRLAETPDDCSIAPDMAPFAGLPMNLNRADTRDLTRLPGIGPVLAERITARRAELGGFATLDELTSVPGLGETTLNKLRPHLCLR